MKLARLALALCACGAAACAPRLVAGTMTNPARAKDKLEAAQEFDLGPYKQNHRYKLTVKDWTPSSIGVEVKLAELGDCALAQSYVYTLVDDGGGRHPMRAAGEPTQTSEKGDGSATLTVSTFGGTFDVPIGAETRQITIEQRPQPGVGCPALDFRWTLQ
jgi:hypothetical protein